MRSENAITRIKRIAQGDTHWGKLENGCGL